MADSSITVKELYQHAKANSIRAANELKGRAVTLQVTTMNKSSRLELNTDLTTCRSEIYELGTKKEAEEDALDKVVIKPEQYDSIKDMDSGDTVKVVIKDMEIRTIESSGVISAQIYIITDTLKTVEQGK
jgi:hypothetical protein